MADELLKIIESLNNPWELSKFRTMTQNYSHGIIGKTEFNSLLRGLKEKYLGDRKIDEKKTKEENPNHNDPKVSTAAGPRIRVKLYSANPKEKMEVHSEVKEKLSDVLKAIEERLSSSEMRLYTSLCKGFQSHRFGYDKFVTYLLQLIDQHKSLYQRFIRLAYGDKGKQKVEFEETRHDQDCLGGGDPKIGPQERGWNETNVERNNKKRILSPKDSNLVPLKKRKRSNPERRVTPNYRLIPEELRSPVSDPVLNNTCVLKRYDDFEGGKVLTGTEEEMIKCEDQMYETDMLMSGLRSAVDSAERVMRGEMRVEDLGVKFYRCLEMLYDGDMFEIVREDHQGALPMILIRLNQKLRQLTVARERWKRGWKKTFKRLSPPQKILYLAQKSQVK